MALGSLDQHAELYDKGGTVRIGPLDGIARVRWGRVRDDISRATVDLTTPSKECVEQSLTRLEPGRTELVVFRGGERVWEGPVDRVEWGAEHISIYARDVADYLQQAIMRSAYDNTYPNSTTVINRMVTIMEAELARFEALDPPINVLTHLDARFSDDDARTATSTNPWQYTVFEELDRSARMKGIDYTVLGRSLVMWDTHSSLGQTRVAGAEDFIGTPLITSYGSQLATFAAVTDGLGNVGTFGGTDSYYGLVETLDTAYDEEQDEGEPPSVAEMSSQARRNISGRNPTPVVVRIPDNSRINPASSVFEMDYLVPGVLVPLRADLPGRTMSQVQKIDTVSIDWTPDGEAVTIVLSPAPG